MTPAPSTKEKITVKTAGQPERVRLASSIPGLNWASHLSSGRKPKAIVVNQLASTAIKPKVIITHPGAE